MNINIGLLTVNIHGKDQVKIVTTVNYCCKNKEFIKSCKMDRDLTFLYKKIGLISILM
jgi:hypothetical protein